MLVDQDDHRRAVAWLDDQLGASQRMKSQLEIFASELVKENSAQNLIASGTIPTIWTRHIVDCAQLICYVPRGTSTWVDIGSGAGLPGVVCAILLPSIQFTLLEQRPLRTAWLSRIVAYLQVENVEVRTGNAAKFANASYDIISARAFAPLPKLLDLSSGLSTSDTTWILPKGRSAQHEVNGIDTWHHTFHVEQSVTDPQSGIVVGNLIGRKGVRRR